MGIILESLAKKDTQVTKKKDINEKIDNDQ